MNHSFEFNDYGGDHLFYDDFRLKELCNSFIELSIYTRKAIYIVAYLFHLTDFTFTQG